MKPALRMFARSQSDCSAVRQGSLEQILMRPSCGGASLSPQRESRNKSPVPVWPEFAERSAAAPESGSLPGAWRGVDGGLPEAAGTVMMATVDGDYEARKGETAPFRGVTVRVAELFPPW